MHKLDVKCKQTHPGFGFEGLLSSFSITISIGPQHTHTHTYIYIYICIYIYIYILMFSDDVFGIFQILYMRFHIILTECAMNGYQYVRIEKLSYRTNIYVISKKENSTGE